MQENLLKIIFLKQYSNYLYCRDSKCILKQAKISYDSIIYRLKNTVSQSPGEDILWKPVKYFP